ncbi:MAG: rod shape-determining protein MreD [Pseudomonadota bacterium]
MTPGSARNSWVIVLTFVLALVLTMMPLPYALELVRPEWVALCLIYWCLALPERIGITLGWLMGLLLDVARGAVLGQHALALTIIAFLTVRLHRRIRLFPVWQQAASVLMLVLLGQMVALWIRGAVGQPSGGWLTWLPALSSMLAWPIIYYFLRHLRRAFQVK